MQHIVTQYRASHRVFAGSAPTRGLSIAARTHTRTLTPPLQTASASASASGLAPSHPPRVVPTPAARRTCHTRGPRPTSATASRLARPAHLPWLTASRPLRPLHPHLPSLPRPRHSNSLLRLQFPVLARGAAEACRDGRAAQGRVRMGKGGAVDIRAVDSGVPHIGRIYAPGGRKKNRPGFRMHLRKVAIQSASHAKGKRRKVQERGKLTEDSPMPRQAPLDDPDTPPDTPKRRRDRKGAPEEAPLSPPLVARTEGSASIGSAGAVVGIEELRTAREKGGIRRRREELRISKSNFWSVGRSNVATRDRTAFIDDDVLFEFENKYKNRIDHQGKGERDTHLPDRVSVGFQILECKTRKMINGNLIQQLSTAIRWRRLGQSNINTKVLPVLLRALNSALHFAFIHCPFSSRFHQFTPRPELTEELTQIVTGAQRTQDSRIGTACVPLPDATATTENVVHPPSCMHPALSPPKRNPHHLALGGPALQSVEGHKYAGGDTASPCKDPHPIMHRRILPVSPHPERTDLACTTAQRTAVSLRRRLGHASDHCTLPRLRESSRVPSTRRVTLTLTLHGQKLPSIAPNRRARGQLTRARSNNARSPKNGEWAAAWGIVGDIQGARYRRWNKDEKYETITELSLRAMYTASTVVRIARAFPEEFSERMQIQHTNIAQQWHRAPRVRAVGSMEDERLTQKLHQRDATRDSGGRAP
ncbi:hypothetical protein C8F04DRAFT_1236590 [Mycena alexandri]|uniref:Uncharacterized protein n=1 Tax=Mycena alexandri TaxID=1745969 RepID=A0AAD6SR16_9AGAR|nr:hypothetical protein C8F04DRAFT_1236590 [Mycena alexandri]